MTENPKIPEGSLQPSHVIAGACALWVKCPAGMPRTRSKAESSVANPLVKRPPRTATSLSEL
jgi:hypothetical protein